MLFIESRFEVQRRLKTNSRFFFFENASMNDFILNDWKIFEYIIFDETIETLLIQNFEIIFFKKKFVDVFKHISIVIRNRWLLNFQWLNVFYMKIFLFFDLRIVFFLFDLFAKTFHYILICVLNWNIVLHYFDDFFIILFFDIDFEFHKI